jgi:hypothetical protein
MRKNTILLKKIFFFAGSNGPQPFTIEKWGNVNNFPRAHTCFNRFVHFPRIIGGLGRIRSFMIVNQDFLV